MGLGAVAASAASCTLRGNQVVPECRAQQQVGTHVYHITRLTAESARDHAVANWFHVVSHYFSAFFSGESN